MGSSSPSKRRPKLEPISLAELEADSTMVGFTFPATAADRAEQQSNS